MQYLIREKPAWYKLLKYTLLVFSILFVLTWFVDSSDNDANPKRIPSIEEVVPKNIEVDKTHYNQITAAVVKGNDPVIKEVADKVVVKACGNSNKLCHAKALYFFVRDKFVHIDDPTNGEFVKTARQTLITRGGDCDDVSVLLASLLNSIGTKTKFVYVPGHVYVQAYLPEVLKDHSAEESFVNLDPSCVDCEFGEISPEFDGQKKEIIG